MRILCIPDVHLKPWIFNLAESILRRGKADKAIFLGDLVDDWTAEFHLELYQQTFDRFKKFLDDFPETLICWGNHDYGYIYDKPQSGFNKAVAYTVVKNWEQIITRYKSPQIVHKVDNVLFSHAGVTEDYMKRIGKNIDSIEYDNADSLWLGQTPLWFRITMTYSEPYKKDKYFQVVGHTPVEKVGVYKGILHTDVFSTTIHGKQIGESGFAIVDTEEKKWHTVKIKTPQE